MAKKKTKSRRKPAQKTKKRTRRDLLASVGIYKCWLCSETVPTLQKFSEHLMAKHEVTHDEYSKLFPSHARALLLSRDLVTGEQVYRALEYRAMNGCWPDWFDGNKCARLEEGDPRLVQALATTLAGFVMQCIAPASAFMSAGIRRYFDMARATEGSETALLRRMDRADSVIERGLSVLNQVTAIVERATKNGIAVSSMPGTRISLSAETMVPSGVTPGNVEKLQHQATAQLSELGAQVQAFLSKPPEEAPQTIDAVVVKKPEEDGKDKKNASS